MQFYIVDNDPIRNIKLLPEYALKKVNIREGYQILSDICHIHKITWEGQNKLYSASHVLTRSFCQNRKEFQRFINHYETQVYWVGGLYKRKYNIFKVTSLNNLIKSIPSNRTREQFSATYLLNMKAKHFSDIERIKLLEVFNAEIN